MRASADAVSAWESQSVVLDEQGANADTIRTNAQRQRAQAFSNGMDGEALNTNRDAQTGKLLMSYGNFVEGLSDPARLEAYFAKNGGGGNSALDAGLASVAGAGQIQEAQKGLSALRNYVTEKGVDAQERYQTGQQTRERADSQAAAEQARRQQQADFQRSKQPEDQRGMTNRANQAFLNTSSVSDNPFWDPNAYAGSTGQQRKNFDTDLAKLDPFGKRFAKAPAAPKSNIFPSWVPKPGGF